MCVLATINLIVFWFRLLLKEREPLLRSLWVLALNFKLCLRHMISRVACTPGADGDRDCDGDCDSDALCKDVGVSSYYITTTTRTSTSIACQEESENIQNAPTCLRLECVCVCVCGICVHYLCLCVFFLSFFPPTCSAASLLTSPVAGLALLEFQLWLNSIRPEWIVNERTAVVVVAVAEYVGVCTQIN